MATREIRARTGQLEDPLPEGKKLAEKASCIVVGDAFSYCVINVNNPKTDLFRISQYSAKVCLILRHNGSACFSSIFGSSDFSSRCQGQVSGRDWVSSINSLVELCS